jgi:hypothetical protein
VIPVTTPVRVAIGRECRNDEAERRREVRRSADDQVQRRDGPDTRCPKCSAVTTQILRLAWRPHGVTWPQCGDADHRAPARRATHTTIEARMTSSASCGASQAGERVTWWQPVQAIRVRKSTRTRTKAPRDRCGLVP